MTRAEAALHAPGPPVPTARTSTAPAVVVGSVVEVTVRGSTWTDDGTPTRRASTATVRPPGGGEGRLQRATTPPTVAEACGAARATAAGPVALLTRTGLSV